MIVKLCDKNATNLKVKICGIVDPVQGREIAALGADALGFICVDRSPRYVGPELIRAIGERLPLTVARLGVFASASLAEIVAVVETAGLTGVQLHGSEPPDFCWQLRQALPTREIVKALRVRDRQTLAEAARYQNCVDAILLDAFDPHQLGGTGHTLRWHDLEDFCPPLPWFLAGGLTPENIGAALARLAPSGIDLSSGIERSPGDKDLARAVALFTAIAAWR